MQDGLASVPTLIIRDDPFFPLFPCSIGTSLFDVLSFFVALCELNSLPPKGGRFGIG